MADNIVNRFAKRKAQYQPSDERLKEIGEAVLEGAYSVFAEAGVENDFGIQDTSGGVAVFGSTNRLVWSPTQGYRPDRSLCTKRFLGAADLRISGGLIVY